MSKYESPIERLKKLSIQPPKNPGARLVSGMDLQRTMTYPERINMLVEGVNAALYRAHPGPFREVDAWISSLSPDDLTINEVVALLASLQGPLKDFEWRERWFLAAWDSVKAREPGKAEFLLGEL